MTKISALFLTIMAVFLMGAGKVVDNIHITGSEITSVVTNGSLHLNANGTGQVIMNSALRVSASTNGTSGHEFDVNGNVIADNILSTTKLVIGASTLGSEELEVVGGGQISGTLGVGTTTGVTDEALLELKSTSKAFYIVPMTEVQRDAISSPQEGFILFNDDEGLPNFYDGTDWHSFLIAADAIVSTESNVRIESGVFECDATSQVLVENGAWIESIGNVSSGQCVIEMTSGVFDAPPMCMAMHRTNTTDTGTILMAEATTITNLFIDAENDSGGSANSEPAVICVGY